MSFFSRQRNTPQYNILNKNQKVSLVKEIIQRFGSIAKERSKYTNLYLGQQVYAQLHPRLTGDGIDLALRECDDDESLPKCNVLRRIEIRELKGYWKANKSWLEGNGRFTEHPAAAFHIPGSMQDEHENPGWKELKTLLDYTAKKLSQK